MTNSANLPAPFKGIDETTPIAALKSPYCERLKNFNVTQAGISLRHGDSVVQYNSSLIIALALASFNTTLYTVCCDSDYIYVYDTLTNTLLYTSAIGETGTPMWSVCFGQRLFIWNQDGTNNNGVVLDTTTNTWGLIAYTGTIVGEGVGSACVYRNRMYMTKSYENTAPTTRFQQVFWYTNIDAVSGAVTQVDLSTVFSSASNLSFAAPLTIADNVESVTMLCFVAMSGEILFYTGSYPDSSSWGLVGRAQIGELIDYSAYVAYQGDVLAFCKNGLVSLRDLFLKGSEQAANLTVNTNIQESWKTAVSNTPIISATKNSRIKGCWDSKKNRIIIQFPIASFDSTTKGGCAFVFDTLRKGWTFHASGVSGSTVPFIDIRFCNGKVYSLVGESSEPFLVYEKEGATGFTDRNASNSGETTYTYEMLSAPIPFPKTAVYETTQIEPILESDLYAQTNWNLVADFGRQTSGNQTTDASTTSVAKPSVNVGMQNITYVQVKMSGTTTTGKSVGLDLYSYNVWYNSGEIGSR